MPPLYIRELTYIALIASYTVVSSFHAAESYLLTAYEIDATMNLRFFDGHDNEVYLETLDNIGLYSYPLMTWYLSPKYLAAILWLSYLTLH